MKLVDVTGRHLRLLTETIAAVNSSLDLQEVLDLVPRPTRGSRVEEMTRTPRMRPGEGITGAAAAERAPVMIPSQAHLDPRFKLFANLPEAEYESILAVPIVTRTDELEGALNVRTRDPRVFSGEEIE